MLENQQLHNTLPPSLLQEKFFEWALSQTERNEPKVTRASSSVLAPVPKHNSDPARSYASAHREERSCKSHILKSSTHAPFVSNRRPPRIKLKRLAAHDIRPQTSIIERSFQSAKHGDALQYSLQNLAKTIKLITSPASRPSPHPLQPSFAPILYRRPQTNPQSILQSEICTKVIDSSSLMDIHDPTIVLDARQRKQLRRELRVQKREFLLMAQKIENCKQLCSSALQHVKRQQLWAHDDRLACREQLDGVDRLLRETQLTQVPAGKRLQHDFYDTLERGPVCPRAPELVPSSSKVLGEATDPHGLNAADEALYEYEEDELITDYRGRKYPLNHPSRQVRMLRARLRLDLDPVRSGLQSGSAKAKRVSVFGAEEPRELKEYLDDTAVSMQVQYCCEAEEILKTRRDTLLSPKSLMLMSPTSACSNPSLFTLDCSEADSMRGAAFGLGAVHHESEEDPLSPNLLIAQTNTQQKEDLMEENAPSFSEFEIEHTIERSVEHTEPIVTSKPIVAKEKAPLSEQEIQDKLAKRSTHWDSDRNKLRALKEEEAVAMTEYFRKQCTRGQLVVRFGKHDRLFTSLPPKDKVSLRGELKSFTFDGFLAHSDTKAIKTILGKQLNPDQGCFYLSIGY